MTKLDSETYIFHLGLICPNCGTGNIETIDSVTVHELSLIHI